MPNVHELHGDPALLLGLSHQPVDQLLLPISLLETPLRDPIICQGDVHISRWAEKPTRKPCVKGIVFTCRIDILLFDLNLNMAKIELEK